MIEVNCGDFGRICRGCLGKNGEMRPLYGSCLDNMLGAVAEIDVATGDGLPDSLCVPCVLQVSRAFTFKQQCRRSDQMLRKALSKEKTINSAQTHQQIQRIDDVTNKSLHSNISGTNVLNDSEFVIGEASETGSAITSDDFLTEVLIDECTVGDCDVMDHSDTNDIAPSKFREYIDGLQLDVANDISLNDSEMSIENATKESFDEIVTEDHSIVMGKSSNTDDCITDVLGAVGSVAELFLAENTIVLSQLDCSSPPPPPPINQDIQTESFDRLTIETTEKSSYECMTCHKVYADSKVLKRHLKIHNPNKPHGCNLCNMSFSESSNLTKHMKRHTGELRNVQGKNHLCSVCGNAFKWASSLSKHMKHHTLSKIFNCPYSNCSKYYVEGRSLNIHLRSHTGDRPFKCKHCNKGFTQTGNLEKHIRVHTGERPFTCPIPTCTKSFSQSGYVNIHLRTHTGERPYRCNFKDCGKSFAGSNTLAIHTRIHSGERPFKCKFCEKDFARQETAIIHQRTHTGERPFSCSICSRNFISSSHLTGHLRSHSNGTKTHECPLSVCQKRFTSTSSLKIHMKTHIEKATTAAAQQQQQAIVSVLTSPMEMSAYDHELIDDAVICTTTTTTTDAM